MKLDTNSNKKKKVYIDTNLDIYNPIDEELLNKKVVTLKDKYVKEFPDLKNKKLEVNTLKNSNLGDMIVWVFYFKNINNNPYLAHYFN